MAYYKKPSNVIKFIIKKTTMFKSFTIAAIAAVASATQWGGYGRQEAAQPAYAVPEYNQNVDVSKRNPERYDDDVVYNKRGVSYEYGRNDGYDDGYRNVGYGDQGRRHGNLDLDDTRQSLPYGAQRSDSRREDSDKNTDNESYSNSHENGDHQNQEFGEKDVRYDDDLDARGLSGLTGGSREQSYGSYGSYSGARFGGSSYDDADYAYGYDNSYGAPSRSYGGYSDESDYGYGSPARSYSDDQGYGAYDSGYGYEQDRSYGLDTGYGRDSGYGRQEQSYGLDLSYGRRSPYEQDRSYGKQEQSYGLDLSYGRSSPYEQDRSYGLDTGYGRDSGYGRQEQSYGLDLSYGRRQEAAQPAYAVPEYNQNVDVSKRNPERYDDDVVYNKRGVSYEYGRNDGYDDGYRNVGYGDQGRRHGNLDLDDTRQSLPYGAQRSDSRREDSDKNTDNESYSNSHENGDH